MKLNDFGLVMLGIAVLYPIVVDLFTSPPPPPPEMCFVVRQESPKVEGWVECTTVLNQDGA